MIIQNETQHYTGQISIILLSLFGFWQPVNLNTKWTIGLYQIYSNFMVFFYTTFTFTLFMYFKNVWENIDSFMLNLYYFFAIFSILIKQITIIIKRNVIIDLQDKLLYKLCQPRDSYEMEILQKQSQICK